MTDPEGRSGKPLFVAGTAPDGSNVPIRNGSLVALGTTLAHVGGMDRPGSPWGGTSFWAGEQSPGESNTAILLNTAPNAAGVSGEEILAHETGHAIANYIGAGKAPLSGASKAAQGEFAAMSRERMQQMGQATGEGVSNRTIGNYAYFGSQNEQFAEGIRQYLFDPNAFKARYPNAAAHLRSIVNGNLNLSHILMLAKAGMSNAFS